MLGLVEPGAEVILIEPLNGLVSGSAHLTVGEELLPGEHVGLPLGHRLAPARRPHHTGKLTGSVRRPS
ncbi:hypothetical protein ACQP1O_19250 [Nocardia sp. CA-151230]|uniref:hypothetical protein n=1 Tax=Nocardia sp. CA-151230 TaxID=3239982 RepID=UPI003D9059D5